MKASTMALAIAALAGCATTGGTMDRIMGSWMGRPADEMVRAWGVPDRGFKTRDGTLYEWTTTQTATTRGAATTTGTISGNYIDLRTTYSPPVTLHGVCVRQVTVGAEGTVIGASWQGNNCCVMAIAGQCRSWLHPTAR
jgi:hypothetical protein